MIYLLTGQNGHGKTLRALEMALAFVAEHRDVYVVKGDEQEPRVRGLDLEKTGFKWVSSFSEWRSLPDGSVVLVDECWRDIPARGPGQKGPDWENELAVHRHRGFDFILITQQGSQISTFVRGLVHEHTHVRRKFGFNRSTLNTWDHFQASPLSSSEIKDARAKSWKYPKKIFALYKSAEVHTVKKSLPWQVYAIPLLALLIVGLVWSVFHRFGTRAEMMAHKAEPSAVAQGSAGGAAQAKKEAPQSREDYLKSITPLVEGEPWTAPIFGGRKPAAEPELYCMSMGDKCACYTEQMTRYALRVDLCRDIALHGIYNPFKVPKREKSDQMYYNGASQFTERAPPPTLQEVVASARKAGAAAGGAAAVASSGGDDDAALQVPHGSGTFRGH